MNSFLSNKFVAISFFTGVGLLGSFLGGEDHRFERTAHGAAQTAKELSDERLQALEDDVLLYGAAVKNIERYGRCLKPAERIVVEAQLIEARNQAAEHLIAVKPGERRQIESIAVALLEAPGDEANVAAQHRAYERSAEVDLRSRFMQ